jgi:hypothetical protein
VVVLHLSSYANFEDCHGGANFAKFSPSLSATAFKGKVVDIRRATGQNIAANIFNDSKSIILNSSEVRYRVKNSRLLEHLLAGIQLFRQPLSWSAR